MFVRRCLYFYEWGNELRLYPLVSLGEYLTVTECTAFIDDPELNLHSDLHDYQGRMTGIRPNASLVFS